MNQHVWIFNGANSQFPSGVFTSKELADIWIKKHGLTGVLTLYPIDNGTYDWAIEEGMFTPRKDHEFSPAFIGKFSSASQEHFHYFDGLIEN
jgi:hypothetical protein